MTIAHGRVGLIAAVAALIGVAGCNKSGSTVADDGLKRDLAAAAGNGLDLAPTTSRPQIVVSAIEAGPSSAPRRAPTKKPATKAATRKEAPTRAPVVAEAPLAPPPVAPVAPVAVEATPITRPALPAPTQQRRVYKTEAEIFRDMPWIRP